MGAVAEECANRDAIAAEGGNVAEATPSVCTEDAGTSYVWSRRTTNDRGHPIPSQIAAHTPENRDERQGADIGSDDLRKRSGLPE
jgi:hypothetical protein